MRWLSVAVALIVATVSSWAQVPRVLSYQGILTDRDGRILPDGDYELQIRLYDRLDATVPIYGERQRVRSQHGVVNVLIGTVEPLPLHLTFDRVYYVGVSVNGSEELQPRTMLTAVPYALRAESAATADVAHSLAPEALKGVTVQTTPSGPAGGDLSGTYPNPSIGSSKVTTVKIATAAVTTDKIAPRAVTGNKINQMGATHGQVLTWVTGSTNDWMPTNVSAWAWALTGNSITGTEFLGTTNNQPLVIRTNNTERMRVTSGGNIGIGTTNPTNLLHVTASSNPVRIQGLSTDNTLDNIVVVDANGVMKIRTATSLSGTLGWSLTGNSSTNPSTNFLGTTDAVDLVVRTNNTERLRVTSSGKVGIGTASPTTQLDVAGTANVSGNTSIGGSAAITGDLTANGNVTLGDASADLLVINAQIGSHLIPNVTNTYDVGSSTLRWRDGWYSGTVTATGVSLNGFTLGSVLFIGSGGALSQDNANFFWDDANNLLGIGTANPMERLHVQGNVRFSGALMPAGNAGTSGDVLVSQGAGTAPVWQPVSSLVNAWSLNGNSITPGDFLGTTNAQPLVIATTNTATPQPIQFWTNNTERMRITATGDVGIGTNSPAATLDVVGTAQVSGNTSVGGNLTVDGNTTLGDDAAVDLVTFNARVQSHVVPSADNTYNLGSATQRWKDVYGVNLYASTGVVTDLTVSNTLNVGNGAIIGGNSSITGDLTVTGHVLPGTDNMYNLGSATQRWANVYGVNGNFSSLAVSGLMPGSVIFAGTGGALSQNNAKFFWDIGNERLGIGTNTPTATLHVVGTAQVSGNTSVGGNLTVAGDATVSGATVALPNIPSGSAATEVLVWNGGNVEHRLASGLISGFAWMLGGNTLASEQTLGTSSAHDLPIITAGMEKVRITQVGDVGIGTSTPGARLHVAGTGRFDGQLTVTAGGAVITGNSTVTGTLTVSSDVSVGGNGSVTGNLTVAGNTTLGDNAAVDLVTFNARVQSNVEPSANNAYNLGSSLLRWANVYGVNGNFSTVTVSGLMPGSVIFAGTGGALSQNNAKFFWDIGNERLGIGTAAPAATLDVVGTAQVSGNTSVGGNLSVGGNGSVTGNLTVSGATVALPNIPSGSAATEVLVWNGGNVEHRLASGLISGFAWMLGGNTLASEQTLGTSSAHDLPIITAGTEKVRITQAGDVGIGTSTPGARLHVAGTGRFDGQLTVTAGGAAITGNSTVTGTLTVSSDVSVGGNGSVTGNLSVDGNTTLGDDAAVDLVTFNARVQSHVVPSADNTYNLGSLTQRWKDVHGVNLYASTGLVTDLTVSNTLNVGNGIVVTGGGANIAGNSSITGNLTVTGHVLPSVDNTYNLGSATQRWANVYGVNGDFSSLTVSGLMPGSVIFAGTGGALSQNNAKFFWDNGNERLGIGTNTPAATLDVVGTAQVSGNTSVGGNLTVAGDATVSGTTVALPNIPSGSAATDVLVRTGTGNVEHRLASGLISGFAWMLGGNTLASEQTLGTSSAHDLPIITAGTEKVRITQAGDVGIGTSTPGAKLHVDGTGRFDGQLTVTTGGAAITGNSTVTGTLTVSSDVSVGGNGSVTGNLSVDGNTTLGDDAAVDLVTFNARVQSHVVPSADNTYNLGSLTQRWKDVYGVNLDASTGVVTDLTVSNTLNVGNGAIIGGNSSIAGDLTVVGNSSITGDLTVTGHVLPGTDNMYNLGSATQRWANVYGVNGNFSTLTVSGLMPGSVIFADAGGALSQNNAKFFWDNGSERLGIGTNTPAATLHVVGTAQVSGNTSVGGNLTVAGDATVSGATVALPNIPSGSAATEVLVWNGGNVEHRLALGLISGFAWMLGGNTLASEQTLGTSSAHDLPIITAGTEKVRITQAGDVGIGTSTPGAKLHVDGTGRFDGQLTVTTGGAAITGNSTVTGTLTVSSDVSVGGNGSVTGNLTVDGNTTLGNNAAVDLVTFTARVQSDVVPSANNTYNLGSSSLRWANIYGDNGSLSGSLTVAGTLNVGNGIVVAANGATIVGNSSITDGHVSLENTDNTARQLRLYEPSGSGTNYTAFRAQAQGSDITYTLPADLSVGTLVSGGRILQSDGSGNLSWLDPSALAAATAWALTGNSITGTEFLGTTNNQPLVIRTNNTERMRITAAGHVLPGADSTYDLGSATQRWASLYAYNGKVDNDLTVSNTLNVGNGILVSAGGINVGGDGATILGNSSITGDLTVTGHVLPGSDNAYDLGSPTDRWHNLYAYNGKVDNDLTVSNTLNVGNGVVVTGGGANIQGDLSTIGGTVAFSETATLTNTGSDLTLPSNVAVVEIVDGPGFDISVYPPATGTQGQVLFIRYSGLWDLTLMGVLPGGGDQTATAQFHAILMYIGGAWRLMSFVD